MIVLKITRPDSDSCIIRADDLKTKVNNPLSIVQEEVRTSIEEGAIGDKIILEVLEMSEEDLANLPEFEGW